MTDLSGQAPPRHLLVTVLACAFAVVACSGTSGPSSTGLTPPSHTAMPSSSPSAEGSASFGGGPAQPCGASRQYQLAYQLPGMEAADVRCDLTYKTVDGIAATLDLYLPTDADAGRRLPVIVFVHGNDDLNDPLKPITEHWKKDGYTNGLVAAASGWAGVTFDYRGYRRSDADALAAAQQDVLDLLAYVADQTDELGLDPSRICLWASSGGGLPAAWAALQGEPGPRCVVTFSARLDGEAAPDRDPVALIRADQPPFFVARGRLDPSAYQGSTRFVEQATAVGAAIVVEDHPGGHAFEQTAEPDSERVIEAALDFLNDQLTGPG